MNLYPLNAEDEYRECDCPLHNNGKHIDGAHLLSCKCNGTGYLGDKDAELVIEVAFLEPAAGRTERGWCWRDTRRTDREAYWCWHGPFGDEDNAEALAAGRAAMGGK